MDQVQKDKTWASAVESAAVTGNKAWQGESDRMRFRYPGQEIYIQRNVRRAMCEVIPSLVTIFRQLAVEDLPWPLYLYGPVGVGKTRAALCLCDVVEYATFHTTRQLCDAVMARQRTSLHDWPVWDWPRCPELAVLDEIGASGEAGKLEYGVVKEFADWRERSSRTAAIFIGNHPPEMLETLYDERVSSRILRGTVFELTGSDRRKR